MIQKSSLPTPPSFLARRGYEANEERRGDEKEGRRWDNGKEKGRFKQIRKTHKRGQEIKRK